MTFHYSYIGIFLHQTRHQHTKNSPSGCDEPPPKVTNRTARERERETSRRRRRPLVNTASECGWWLLVPTKKQAGPPVDRTEISSYRPHAKRRSLVQFSCERESGRSTDYVRHSPTTTPLLVWEACKPRCRRRRRH